MNSYPTLADKTVVERKGDDMLDRGVDLTVLHERRREEEDEEEEFDPEWEREFVDERPEFVDDGQEDLGTSPAPASGEVATGDPRPETAGKPLEHSAHLQPGLHVTFEDAQHEPTRDPAKAVFFAFNCQRNPGRRHYGLPIAGRLIGGDGVPIKRHANYESGGIAQWDFDGNVEQPSLNPSIHCKGCCHGYITKGAWDDRGAG